MGSSNSEYGSEISSRLTFSSAELEEENSTGRKMALRNRSESEHQANNDKSPTEEDAARSRLIDISSAVPPPSELPLEDSSSPPKFSASPPPLLHRPNHEDGKEAEDDESVRRKLMAISYPGVHQPFANELPQPGLS